MTEPQTEARAIPVLLTSASEDLMAYFHATGYDKVPDDIERRLARIEAEARQPALDALREKDIVLAEARADVTALREALDAIADPQRIYTMTVARTIARLALAALDREP